MSGLSETDWFTIIDRMGLTLAHINANLVNINKIMDAQVNAIEGVTYSNRFTIPAGHQVVKLDIADANNFEDTHPEGVSFYLPGHPVASLYLFNEGPGDLNYSFNTQNNSSIANSNLKPGEDRQINLPVRRIRFLNLVSSNGAATVRMEAIA